MFHVVRLGEVWTDPPQVAYAAIGPTDSNMCVASDDVAGVTELMGRANGEALVCEPVLAAAAKKLGL
jgi:hypothetical protein